MCGLPSVAPSGFADSTSAIEICIPPALSNSIIFFARGIRPSRVFSSISCISTRVPSNSKPSICTLIPSFVRHEISAPSARDKFGRSACCAACHPDVVSWSVSAKTEIPSASALLTSCAGESVPSLQFVCVCKSIMALTQLLKFVCAELRVHNRRGLKQYLEGFQPVEFDLATKWQAGKRQVLQRK